MLFKRVFLFLALTAILFRGAKPFNNFSRGSSKEHFCKIILKSAHWPWRRCGLNGFSMFSFDGHFVQRSGTILAILVEGHPRKIHVKLF